jgi:hypothetical protein
METTSLVFEKVTPTLFNLAQSRRLTNFSCITFANEQAS